MENAKRIEHEGVMHLPGRPDQVFPLLCPVREYEWIPTWRARMVHSASGFAEAGCVFATPGEGGRETVWTVSRYEPEAGIIEFVAVEPAVRVMKLEIALYGEDEGTRAVWRRTLTALTPAGERSMDAVTPEVFATEFARLEAQLEHYLRTGTALC